MDIKFRDVNSGVVDARAIIKLEGISINEITIINKSGIIEIELPKKSFKGKDGKLHNLDIITFDNENQENLFKIQIKDAFSEWRKMQKKVRIYEN